MHGKNNLIAKDTLNEKNSVVLSLDTALAREIGKSKRGECPYVLFLGAGASVSSGIDESVTLVRKWQQQIYCKIKSYEYPIDEDSKSGKKQIHKFEKWLCKGFWSWFNETIGDDDDKRKKLYSTLFEYMRQSKESRQSFIENLVSDPNVKPSIGYFYLASLLQERIIGCILTTNFDELIADSLYRYYSERPIICAFEASISNFNNSSTRPKIIKLHGDYLFNDIRNTDGELMALDVNMENKMIELCQDRSLVFVGYGGKDESILDPIMKQMHVNDRFLTKDLHWCIKKTPSSSRMHSTRVDQNKIPEKILQLKKRFPNRVHFYEIESFDHFMCEIYAATGYSTVECFKAASKRNVSNLFLEAQEKLKLRSVLHPQMNEDYKNALEFLENEYSRADFALKRANTFWEYGREDRDIKNNYPAAIEKFSEGIDTIDECFKLENPDFEKSGMLYSRKIGCQIGNLKCFSHLRDKKKMRQEIKNISKTERDLDMIVKSLHAKSPDASVLASICYNLVCANCNKIKYGGTKYDDVKDNIKKYIAIMEKTATGRDKIEKLKESEKDIEEYRDKIFGTK